MRRRKIYLLCSSKDKHGSVVGSAKAEIVVEVLVAAGQRPNEEVGTSAVFFDTDRPCRETFVRMADKVLGSPQALSEYWKANGTWVAYV
ncbi:hypothetical protein NDU88_006418 [Pleurodeles waltl]|uniref:Uncharacterized protein n=1 Tax=Pleurodeles waltl TaxID=8319 RepID=A0AAV7X126_PLEWA|nr:hypothetical protein NDU88_006418 [Pleurodeles waltl]